MTRPEILDQAKKCVCGKRQQDYGTPEDNFKIIAKLWNAYLGNDILGANDVAMMMALMKIARIRTGTATEDSFVDLAGYAACGGEIATSENKATTATELSEEEIKELFDTINELKKKTMSYRSYWDIYRDKKKKGEI